MNVLVLEDDPIAFNIIDYLNGCGYKVWHAQSLLDVAYFLEVTPGIDCFDKIMFDVSVPTECFSFFQNAEFEYGKKYRLSGFEFVAKNYNYFVNLIQKKKITLFTAFKVTLFDKIKDKEERRILEEMNILDKGSDDFMMEMLSFLNG